jgi:mannose-6-phosphate isomerase
MVALAGSVNGLGGLYPPNGKAIRFWTMAPPPVHRVDKPWGHEIWWAETEQYAGKLLIVNVGHRLSLQFHREKDETSYLLSGRLRLLQGPSEDALVESEIGAGEEPARTRRRVPALAFALDAFETAGLRRTDSAAALA